MKIRKGWSTEYAALKFDVEVDESDLVRVCDTWQISAAYRAKITTEQAFQILDSLAEWLSLYEAIKLHAAGSQDLNEAQRKSTDAQQAYWNTMGGIRQQLGLPGLQQAVQAQPEASGGTAPGN